MSPRSSYGNLLSTQINPAYFTFICGPHLESEAALIEMKWHRLQPQRRPTQRHYSAVCDETKHNKHARKHEQPVDMLHSHFVIKWLMHRPTPQLAENEGRTKISHVTSYLVEAPSRC